MRSSWIGIIACAFVLYYGVVDPAGTPEILLNTHAIILVVGGTFAIMLLTYPGSRLLEVADFILFGFIFRARREEKSFTKDLLIEIDRYFEQQPRFASSDRPHRFIKEAMALTVDPTLDLKLLHVALMDRRNAVKRKYSEDARILHNIAKYPPHLGLLGAASGMIEMMSGIGKVGVDKIGLSMAVALTATLWGVGLNNFVFLPLADNATKAADDELFLRDVVIDACLMMKRGAPHSLVVNSCINKLSLFDRAVLNSEYAEASKKLPAENKNVV